MSRRNLKDAAKIKRELLRLAKQNGGMLSPEAVVESARSERSILHPHFEWSNTKAAELYRLQQARTLIRVVVDVVTVPGSGKPIAVRTFCSLRGDRGIGRDDGEPVGYRVTAKVMKDDDLRAELVRQFKEDAKLFADRYRNLQEACEVVAAIDKVVTS